ncbi:MAG: phosphate acetyltransferase [Actinomycetia bacterium]|nr:phosphate acetyltransferase [Actinomycetes bacterium]
MVTSVYVVAPEGLVGKSAVALGVIDALAQEVGSVGVFRPIIRTDRRDQILKTLVSQPSVNGDYEASYGVTYEELHRDLDEAMSQVIARYTELAERYPAVVILGSDYTDVLASRELSYNAMVAANLDAPALLVVKGNDKTPEQLLRAAENAVAELREHHVPTIGLIASRIEPGQVEAYRQVLAGRYPMVAALPENKVLAAPTVRAQFEAAGARLLRGSEALLDRESQGRVATGMTLPNVLDHLYPEATVVTASDRVDLLPGLLLAHASDAFPSLAGLLLVGGYELPDSVQRLIDSIDSDLPIGTTDLDTYTTAERMLRLEGAMTDSSRKIEIVRGLFGDSVDVSTLLQAVRTARASVRTPLKFEHQLMNQARSDRRTIVLPEASDDRILEAAATLLRRQVADLILLSDEASLRPRAEALGLDLSAARCVDPRDPELLDRFATEYARLRAKKGVTVEQARAKLEDLSYFGTMMVHFGMADGMVSGAVNTTANTIRPSLEFIKTKPGVSVVSSSFMMCLPDRVLVFGDCAVNPNPTAEQLADIAISSAETAVAFGIEPRVAMLSYSTGTSGSGADVDQVREATEIVRGRAPELKVEGPIQFDAAMDPSVARTKMPGSEVAGQATVFIFPDLNTGNNTYKAVQRTAHAVAIGPVLQGLNKPVNDLSRGATVDDILNTVAITAIQAQAEPSGTPAPLAQP